jgi:hypothetical protein
MVYNTQDYCFFFLLFSSSVILGNREHDVSENGSVSVLRWVGKTPAQLDPVERASALHIYIPCSWATRFGHTGPFSGNTWYTTKEAAHPVGHSGRNTKDMKNRHPTAPKLIIITTYCKSTFDKVHSAVDSLKACCLKMALCGLNT